MKNKKIYIPLIVAILVATGFISYAVIASASPLTISIKDAPYDSLVSIDVDIAAVEIQQSGIARWYPLVNAPRTCNCSVDGTVEDICKADIPAGTYTSIRIKLNKIRLQYNNNSLIDVKNRNTICNVWLEYPINFIYDGIGGQVLFDVSINDDLEAVIVIMYANP